MDPSYTVDVACVIHGDLYPWSYVENLYSMVRRQLSYPVRFHVFTERERAVPDHMIKHELRAWPGVTGRKKAWWYKMQMFDPRHELSQTLYLDLDVVLTDNLDWVISRDPGYFWAIRDFRYIWRPNWQGMNSSLMWWNPRDYTGVWRDFKTRTVEQIMRQYAGDQDYLTAMIDANRVRWLDPDRILSWRWQIWEGGLDPRTRRVRSPGSGTVLPEGTAVIVFHGSPKPHEIDCSIVKQHWCPG